MKRRNFLAGSLAVAAGGAWLARPGLEGGPHNAYFAQLNRSLRKAGPMRPVMLVDLDRLDENIAALKNGAPAGKHIRVVAKSLPSMDLLNYIQGQLRTERLMLFHQPFLNQVATATPATDVLLGKPLPVESASLFYQRHDPATGFDPARQLQWLVDTPQRLNEYLALAKGRQLKLLISIELDVGLHRGGVIPGGDLATMLNTIASNPEHLSFSGFMGYDPHVVKLPSLIASRESLLAQVGSTYQSAIEQVKREHAELWTSKLTMNTAGSPTYRLHDKETYSTEVAVGSALVKPTDFDIDTLQEHTPAAFIATPVLKANDGLRLPAADALSKAIQLWDRNQQRGYFTYGGSWKAKYVSPPGLKHSSLYGNSTNQELVLGSLQTDLQVGDQIFLRPTQSEFVMLQFGDLLAVRQGEIVDSWPVMTNAASVSA